MKVVLNMAVTINGHIAKLDNNTDWVSEEEWNGWLKNVEEAGNLILGRKTYEQMLKGGELEDVKEVKVVVVSRRGYKTDLPNHTVVATPQDAINQFLEEDMVVLGGGGDLNASFLKEGLVDEVYIDIEPIMFGSGIGLAYGEEFETKLKYLGIKNITDDCIQLHYKVQK